MAEQERDTEELLRRAAEYDRQATHILLDRHRDRLRTMVSLRLDPRVNPRLDPSDVVQDVLIKAFSRLPDYAKAKPIPFYPWLRQIAWEQIMETHRVHVAAQRRSVVREVNPNRFTPALPDQSAVLLADLLTAQQSTPSQQMEREQMRIQVRRAVDSLDESYRELLVMRYLEKLSMREIAACLGSTESAIKMRHMRALRKMGKKLRASGFSDD